MHIVIILFSAFIAILVILFIFYVTDTLMSFVTFEKLFKNFMMIKESTNNFSDSYFNYLCQELQNTFHSDATLMFLAKNNKLILSFYYTREINKMNRYIEIIKNNVITIDKKSIQNIIADRFSIKIVNLILSDIIKKTKYKKYLFIPVSQGKQLIAIYVMLYEKIIPYIRGVKYYFINSDKYKKILLDIILVSYSNDEGMTSKMMEHIRDYALIITNHEFCITSWNKGAEIIFGYMVKDVIGESLIDYMDKDYYDDFDKAIFITGKKDEAHLKMNMIDSNNTKIVCEVLIKQINMQSKIYGYYMLIKDISKEEILKSNIRSKSMISRSIVDNARDGIMVLNEEDRVIFYNERLRNISETQVAFLGMGVGDIFSVKISEQIKLNIEDMKTNKIDFSFFDIPIGEFWYNIRLFPMGNINTKYNGMIIFFIDNTVKMNYQEKLIKQKDMLAMVNENLLDNLKSARIMQLNLISKYLPDNRKIKFRKIFKMSEQIGGDFYCVETIKIKNTNYYIAMISDVSGHGVEASMLTVFLKDVYNDFKHSLEDIEDLRPAVFMNLLNKRIVELSEHIYNFITVFFSIIDLKKGIIKYSSGGHPPMILIRNNKFINRYGIQNSPPLGLRDDIIYKEDSVEIGPKDKIILYTDGVIDLFSTEDDYLGDIDNFLQANKSATVNELEIKFMKIIDKQSKIENPDKDDITLLMAQIK